MTACMHLISLVVSEISGITATNVSVSYPINIFVPLEIDKYKTFIKTPITF